MSTEVPETTEHAITRFNELKSTTHLRVWVNKKYPEILAYCYDNTAFGTIEASDAYSPPSVNISKAVDNFTRVPNINNLESYETDDIPF